MDEGLIGLIMLIAINIVLSILLCLYRKKYQRVDLSAVLMSAAAATVFFHIFAAIIDIKGLMWLLISIPIAFIYGLLVSSLTNIFVQWYIMHKHKEN